MEPTEKNKINKYRSQFRSKKKLLNSPIPNWKRVNIWGRFFIKSIPVSEKHGGTKADFLTKTKLRSQISELSVDTYKIFTHTHTHNDQTKLK